MSKKWMIGSLASKAVMLLLSIVVLCFGVMMIPSRAHAAPEGGAQLAEHAGGQSASAAALGMKYLSAAIAVGLGSIAGGIAVAMVGSAAMGAVAERPELMGRSLIYVGLAEGLAIYGMVIAILILVT